MILSRIAAVALVASVANGSTWIVDAAGGGQFTDIQTAILASQPGDVLLVQPGTYAPFALDRGLTLIGYGACNVSGGITIAGLPATQTAALVHIEAPTLDIQTCDGPVLVQDTTQLGSISVSNSLDVRLARIVMPAPASLAPLPGLSVDSSRVEVDSSSIYGGWGADCATPAVDGAIGASCGDSRLHMSRCSLMGGFGSGCYQQNYYCANGGTGLDLQSGADVILCGRALDQFAGGPGGLNLWYNDCTHDGVSEIPIALRTGATLRHSGVTIHDWIIEFGIQCMVLQYPGVQNLGGTEVQPADADPTLDVSGNPVAGGTLVFTLDAPPGSSALLSFGRRAVVSPDPNTVIEVLTPPSRTLNLGQIPASGTTTFTWHVSTLLPPGAKLFAQAKVTVSPTDVRRTNSIPVILR
jgi:hypothetical protein